ncbi:MAG: hypothetical protein IPK26_02085 [Planctomycetes bacterium]|nr:hypothetical protein [Planctomycetota bacterium]
MNSIDGLQGGLPIVPRPEGGIPICDVEARRQLQLPAADATPSRLAPGRDSADAGLQEVLADGRAAGLAGDPLRQHVLTELVKAEMGPGVPADVVQRTVAAAAADPGMRRLTEAAIAQASGRATRA